MYTVSASRCLYRAWILPNRPSSDSLTPAAVPSPRRLAREALSRLDPAALDAIRPWRFDPALLDGEPVAVHYDPTINYRLQSEKEGS